MTQSLDVRGKIERSGHCSVYEGGERLSFDDRHREMGVLGPAGLRGNLDSSFTRARVIRMRRLALLKKDR